MVISRDSDVWAAGFGELYVLGFTFEILWTFREAINEVSSLWTI